MSIGTWQSIATVLAMIAFAGICWWAYTPRNRRRFEEDGRIVLDTDPLHGKAAPAPASTSLSREKQP